MYVKPELTMKIIKLIYDRLGDSASRDIYANRLLYSLTEDCRYIRNVILTTKEGKSFCERLSETKKVIYGAGEWGREILRTYGSNHFECFVDNNRENIMCGGLPVLSFDEYIKRYRDALVIISTRLYHDEIKRQLLANGIGKANIIDAGEMIDAMSGRQYFDLPELKLCKYEEENFVDGGCFDGKTSVCFLKWCKDNNRSVGKVWAFEPDTNNIGKVIEMFRENGLKKFEIMSKCLWNSETELGFLSGGNGASRICRDGMEQMKTIPMDKAVKGKISFIKLDVEGAEWEVLSGAAGIIKNCRPRLAISIYHKPEDIWQLPCLLHEIRPDYRFYLRHYSVAAAETVLYAL